MKYFYSNNPELDEILTENGINLVCDALMNVTVSDEDAARIPAIVAELAPAASGDYSIEPCTYSNSRPLDREELYCLEQEIAETEADCIYGL